jgi:hypothetical protein
VLRFAQEIWPTSGEIQPFGFRAESIGTRVVVFWQNGQNGRTEESRKSNAFSLDAKTKRASRDYQHHSSRCCPNQLVVPLIAR